MMDDDTYTERAARGAAFLDKMMPGWFGLVDLSTLDMSTGEFCVLGQLFSGPADSPFDDSPYMKGVVELEIEDVVGLGFIEGFPGRYGLLNSEWTQQITARLIAQSIEESK